MILPNPLRTHKTVAEKEQAFYKDIVSSAKTPTTIAYRADGGWSHLANLKPAQVEFIGGLWRVQRETTYQIQRIRDMDLILGERLPHQENTFFEYYRAMRPTFNCYGLIESNNFDLVVAKYTTDTGISWGYGKTIEQARAFLGIRLYDQHKNLIHSVVCANKRQK